MSPRGNGRADDWHALLFQKVRSLYPDERFPRGHDALTAWWLGNALPRLLSFNIDETTREERDAVRSRTWDMLVHSCRKLHAVTEIASQVNLRLKTTHPGHGVLTSSLAVAVLGSVSRLEAEVYSDVDPDILFDSPPGQAKLFNNMLHDEFAREVSSRTDVLVHSNGVYAKVEDVRIYSYGDIEEELRAGTYDHVSKLLLEATFVVQPRQFSRKVRKWSGMATAQGMVAERQHWLEERQRKLMEDIGRGQQYPKSSMFHMLTSFYCQMLALRYGDRPEAAKQPFWKIADTLIGILPTNVAVVLQRCVFDTIKIRAETMPRSEDILKLTRYINKLDELALGLFWQRG